MFPAVLAYQVKALQLECAHQRHSDLCDRIARIARRQALQRLELTDEQMERFQDRVRGIERRLADVLARKSKNREAA